MTGVTDRQTDRDRITTHDALMQRTSMYLWQHILKVLC